MDSAREVVITGVGIVSPIGIGNDAFSQSLRAKLSGVRRIVTLENSPWPVKIGADIPDFDGKLYVQPRKSLKVMCREIQLGFSAAALAMNHSGLQTGQVEPERIGVIYGSEMFYGEIDEIAPAFQASIVSGEFEFSRWGKEGLAKLYPLWMLKYLPNMVGCHIGIAQDARGPNNTITLGEASSLLAIIEGSNVIERGHADVMIVGGTGSRLNLTPMMYRGVSNLSHFAGDPRAASRPFDKQRAGMVNGEGAGALILESREHAIARGANVLASIVGFGRGYETPAWAGSSPNGAGLKNAIRGALRSSNLAADEIGHVNAHGLGGVLEDRVEAAAIRETLGDVPVTALKSYFGNLGAGGGAVELAASILAFTENAIPVTLNRDEPDPECPIEIVTDSQHSLGHPTAIKLSQSGTGQTAAVIVRRAG